MSIALASAIESVLLFPQGAEVTRVAPLALNCTEVRFAELPIGLLDDSVSINLEGVEDTVSSVQFTVGLEVTKTSETSNLAQEILRATLEEQRYQASLAAEEQLLQLFLHLSHQARPVNKLGQEPPPQQVDKVLEFLDFRTSQMEQIQQRILDGKVKLREASEKLQALKLRELQAAREVEPEELRKAVSIQLSEPTQLKDARVKLRYRIDGARWAPAYEAKFHPESGELDFSMRALVCQASEEDWSNVRLSLSTSSPTEIRECPKLKSLKIGRAQSDLTGHTFRPPPSGTQELFAGFDLARKAKPLPPVYAPPPPTSAVQRLDSSVLADYHKEKAETFRDGASMEDEDFEESPLADSSTFFGGGAPCDELMSRSESPAEPVLMKKRKSLASKTPPQRQEVVTLTSDEKLWEFGRLRLPHWENSKRGELVYHESWELYQETTHISHNIVVSALNGASIMTSSVLQRSLPNGYFPPQAIAGFDHLYETRGKVDVPADGQFHSVPVFSRQLPSSAEYVAVPRESLDVFRTVKANNESHHGFCSGPIDVFLGQDFLHTTQLSQVEPSARFEIGLGVCQAIEVSRQSTFRESSSGLMSQTTSLPHQVDFQLTNHLAQEVKVTVRERLPEVDDEFKNDLKVEQEKNKDWAPFEETNLPSLTSGLKALVKLASGESKSLQLKYTLSMSSKYEIVGGNRREAQV